MSQVSYHKPTDAAVAHIARHMRAADVVEAEAASGLTAWEALEASLRGSALSAVARVADRPVAALGLQVVCPLTGRGAPWMLGTDEVFATRHVWVRDVRPVIAQMLSVTPRLVNYVHEANHVSVRWLRRVGFRVDDAATLIRGHRFHEFTMERQ